MRKSPKKKKPKKPSRVEKLYITSTNPYYDMLMDFCHNSKNLYNYANYLARQEFFATGKPLRDKALDKILKADTQYPDYQNMPTAQSAQQTLKVLDANWKSYFSALKEWKIDPKKFLGKPKPPKYLDKDGYFVLTLTNQNCKLENGVIRFPKVFKGFTLQPHCFAYDYFVSFQQVRIFPKKDKLVVEVVYNVKEETPLQNNDRYLSIDIGMNCLLTAANNIGLPGFFVNGRPLKSINHCFNEEYNHYKSIAKLMNNKDFTHRTRALLEKRNHKINDYLHKTSRYVVDYCLSNDIHTIVIGKSDDWKQKPKMNHKTKQSFMQIPFSRLIEMIEYKAKTYGIAVIVTEERYTSGTSFIDNELPVKENYNKARRKERGLFVSNNGLHIHADMNGAYQIMRKVVPIEWNDNYALHPYEVKVA